MKIWTFIMAMLMFSPLTESSIPEGGTVSLDVVAKGKNIKVEMTGSAETFFGFSEPNSPRKVRKVSDAKKLLKEEFKKMVLPSRSLRCDVENSEVEIKFAEGKGTVNVKAGFLCRKKVSRFVEVGIKKYFANTKKVEAKVTTSAGDSYTKTIKRKKGILKL